MGLFDKLKRKVKKVAAGEKKGGAVSVEAGGEMRTAKLSRVIISPEERGKRLGQMGSPFMAQLQALRSKIM